MATNNGGGLIANGNHGGAAPPGSAIAPNPFAASGLFVKTADIWTPYKMSYEGFAGGGKSTTMCCVAVGIWTAEGKTGNVILVDTEKSAKFIVPFLAQFGLVEGKNLFVTHSRDLRVWGQVLEMCEKQRGNIMMTDTVTHIYEEMILQFERDNERKVKYPKDAMAIKPMWKERFSTPFTQASNTHLLFTGRAAWEYTMQYDEETKTKSFEATGVKMRGDNELAYEPDVVVLMERLQKIEDGNVMTARGATILKDRSRQIDGKQFVFKPYGFDKEGLTVAIGDKEIQAQVWKVFEPVYRVLASGNANTPATEADKQLGPLFQKGGGEAWYQLRLQAERTVEEIKEVYCQWGIGGTGGVEKMLRAMINLAVFQQRATESLKELNPRDLRDGLDHVDHLTRFAASKMELIEKMFKASQYEQINELIGEEFKAYSAQRPTGPGSVWDDEVPEFAVPKKDAPAATALPATLDDLILAMTADNTADLERWVAELAAPIAALEPKDRKKLENAVNARKRAFKDAATECRAVEGRVA